MAPGGRTRLRADDPDAAEEHLLRSMIWSGAKYLARVAFGSGDEEEVVAICSERALAFCREEGASSDSR